jgi:hypothetical protein
MPMQSGRNRSWISYISAFVQLFVTKHRTPGLTHVRAWYLLEKTMLASYLLAVLLYVSSTHFLPVVDRINVLQPIRSTARGRGPATQSAVEVTWCSTVERPFVNSIY